MTTLLIIQIFITIAMICLILLQRSEGGALSGMGGSNNMFTARGTANLLTRATGILAAIFMSNCVLMTIINSYTIKQESKVLEVQDVLVPEVKKSNS